MIPGKLSHHEAEGFSLEKPHGNEKKWWKDEAHKHNMANHLSNTVTKGSMEVWYWQLIRCLGRNISMLRRECGVESACFIAASSHEHYKSIQPSNNSYGSGNLLD